MYTYRVRKVWAMMNELSSLLSNRNLEEPLKYPLRYSGQLWSVLLTLAGECRLSSDHIDTSYQSFALSAETRCPVLPSSPLVGNINCHGKGTKSYQTRENRKKWKDRRWGQRRHLQTGQYAGHRGVLSSHCPGQPPSTASATQAGVLLARRQI